MNNYCPKLNNQWPTISAMVDFAVDYGTTATIVFSQDVFNLLSPT